MAQAILQPGGGNLYLICDGETCLRHHLPLADFVRAATSAGAKTLQYRHKGISVAEYEHNLRMLLPVAEHYGTTLIVNDHAAIAERLRLPLHLGQEDPLPAGLSVSYGRSTHTLAELDYALGCNPAPEYVALGTMFVSSTKPDVSSNRTLISAYRARTTLPLVLIGGITLDNVRELPRAETIFYAIIGDAFRFGATSEGITKYVESFRSA